MTPLRKLLVALVLVLAASGGAALADVDVAATNLPQTEAPPAPDVPQAPLPQTGDSICAFGGHDDVEIRQCVPLP